MGVLHMHTLYSDGTGTVGQIANYAEERGLQWLIITDHCHLEAYERGEYGRYGNVWVLIGTELGDEDLPNHYLAYGITELPEQLDPVQMVKDVTKLGGFGAIAHPHEKRDEFEEMPPYPWTAWEAPFDGIEIWNQLSQWVEGLTHTNKYRRFLHPLKSLTGPDKATLRIWDELNLRRPVVGYVGVDAHALDYPVLRGMFKLRVFAYKVQFRSLQTHLLLPEPLNQSDFQIANEQILTALRNGHHYGANHRVGDARGFRFIATQGGIHYHPIATLTSGETIHFRVKVPMCARIHLIRNGQLLMRVRGRSLRYESSQPGIYRVEVFRKATGWIFSNPFRVVDSAKCG
ncbi:MAG TPA: PHP domain-containing protein [Bacteroidetes bacterium]|nr:PHP domain-containing protein [Bacteroidota bacterium]HEX03742.1 PHP domain-containing protein [Bacteroidota bacterium]